MNTAQPWAAKSAGVVVRDDPLRRMLASSVGRNSARAVLVAATLLAWEYLPGTAMRFWASSPSAIMGTLWGWIVDGSVWSHLGSTLLVMLLGYGLGCISGIGAGLLFGFFPRVHRILSPYIAAAYALPKIALAPLLIILLGIGMESKVTLVAITVFFLVFTSTLDGIRDIDPDLIRTADLMGASRGEVIQKIMLPATVPWMFTGMRIAVRYAFTTTVLAELIAANKGIGFLIEFNSASFNATGAYAAIVVLVVFSVAFTETLSWLERRMPRQTGHESAPVSPRR